MTPRIGAVRFRFVHRRLTEAGFEVVRQTGSHIRYKHADGRRTTVPRQAEIGPGLALRIWRDAGLDPGELRLG